VSSKDIPGGEQEMAAEAENPLLLLARAMGLVLDADLDSKN
jgi:hypothetical protein